MEKERAEKRKSRTRSFFGLGGGNKSSNSAAATTAAANSNVQPTDDGQELDDLICALRSGDIFDDVKRRKNKKGKSTKTSTDSSKHRLI